MKLQIKLIKTFTHLLKLTTIHTSSIWSFNSILRIECVHLPERYRKEIGIAHRVFYESTFEGKNWTCYWARFARFQGCKRAWCRKTHPAIAANRLIPFCSPIDWHQTWNSTICREIPFDIFRIRASMIWQGKVQRIKGPALKVSQCNVRKWDAG